MRWPSAASITTGLGATRDFHHGPLAVPAGHFVYIPAILLFGLVAGWILGSRAAADAYAAELRRREERAAKKKAQQRPEA